MRSVLVADDTIERILALGPKAVPEEANTIQARVNFGLRVWLNLLRSRPEQWADDLAEAERKATGPAMAHQRASEKGAKYAT